MYLETVAPPNGVASPFPAVGASLESVKPTRRHTRSEWARHWFARVQVALLVTFLGIAIHAVLMRPNSTDRPRPAPAPMERLPAPAEPPPSFFLPPSAPTDCRPRATCCRICRKGKACGDSCIERSLTCHKGRGCACDEVEICA